MIRFCFLALLLVGTSASARVFTMADSNVAAYFRGTGGMNMMGGTAYSTSSGNATYFDDKYKPLYNYSGEIGVLIHMGESVSMRLAVEGLQSREVTAVGESGAGVKYMDVDSKIVAFVPNLTFEFKLSGTPNSKTYLFLGGGYATVKGTNDYTMTAAGTTQYGGATNYSETVAGTGLMGQAGAGYEFVMLDNCGFSIEGGWRYLPVSKLKYQDSVTTVSGAVTDGGTAKDFNGGTRKYDMGGPFVGVSFRFYIPPLR
jgi:hypothetical protein